MRNPLVCGDVTSLDEARRFATGEVNKEAPHLTVPFYMPLARPVSHHEAMALCRPDVRDAVTGGTARLLAVASGRMADGDDIRPVQFVLLHGRIHDEDPVLFLVNDCLEDEIDCAVLMDGDGLRCRDNQAISREEVAAYWMSGFLGWNEKCPGLYRLQYALIES